MRGIRSRVPITLTVIGLLFVLTSSPLSLVFAVSGAGTSGNPYVLTTCQEVQNVQNNLSAYYKLGGDIDCSDTATWNSGSGWAPIGNNSSQFTGFFDGDNHSITGMTIARPSTTYVGMFGYLSSFATVQNLTLKNSTIHGQTMVGTLSGYSDATITRVHVLNPSISSVSDSAGGIAGKGGSTITLCSVQDGSVTSGAAWGGGITGWQTSGTISRTWTALDVSALNDAGGIVGYGQNATISNSYARGDVSSPSASENSFGGLAGVGGSILNSYAAGNVTVAGSGYNSGGLFGEGGATIRNSFAVGSVASAAPTGGFVGLNQTTLTNSYSVFGTPVGSGSSSGVTDVASGSVFKGLSHSHAVYNDSGNEWDFVTIWEAHADDYPTLLDNAPPLPLAVSSFSPADEATNVAADGSLSIVFNQAVTKGTGNIVVKQSSNNAVKVTIDVATSAVAGSGTSTITITLPAPLSHNVQYYVQIPSTAFKDASNNAYAGIADTTTWNFTVADDSDGVNEATETAAPNSGDANNDGIADSQQSNVASFENTVTGKYVSLVVDDTCSLSNVSSLNQNTLAADSKHTYPLGLLNFSLTCNGAPGFTTTVTQYFYDAPDSSFVVRKYVNGNYTTVDSATTSRQTIDGHNVLVVSYQVTDGGPLDADGTANSTIVDPAGPAVQQSANSTSGSGLTNTGTRIALVTSTACLLLLATLAAYLWKRTVSETRA